MIPDKYKHTRIRQVTEVLENFSKNKGNFTVELKKYFNLHKYLGSKDRRQLTDLIYEYWRVGIFLEGTQEEKIKLIVDNFGQENPTIIDYNKFPAIDQVSPELDKTQLINQILKRPKVYFQIRKEDVSIVRKELSVDKIEFEELTDCIFNTNSDEKLTNLFAYKTGKFWIQDANTAKSIHIFADPQDNQSWWDACAGAGGKSLSLVNMNSKIRLFASDLREASISNLKDRFKVIFPNQKVNAFVHDATRHLGEGYSLFDGIILDSPCTGSGTWMRNPDQLTQFEVEKIGAYSEVQKSIISKTFEHLKVGGKLLYITCSVYKTENEDVVSHLLKNDKQAELVSQNYLNGFEQNSENIFVAVITKSK